MHAAFAYLAAFHPLVPGLALAAAIFALVYVVRRFTPALWAPLTVWPSADSPLSAIVQALPSVVIGAAVAANAVGDDPMAALYGALAGALAPVWHHILKAAPVAYRGALATVGKRAADAAKRSASLLLVLGVVGCGAFYVASPSGEACYESARAAYWRKVEECKAAGLTANTCPLGTYGEELKAAQEACPE